MGILMSKHPSHSAQTAKINRAIGQLEAVKRMIDSEEYCVDIMTQLRAARNAVKSIELSVLEAHMKACLSESCCDPNPVPKETRIKEIIELLKKYE